MNVIGIEYGRTSSLIVLREGDTPIRSVGDGLRKVIPHAAKAGNDNTSLCWGSHALAPSFCAAETAPTGRSAPETPSQRRNEAFLTDVPLNSAAPSPAAEMLPGAWTDEPEAALFWMGLQERLYRYLGRMTATEVNGYRVVVAISPGSSPAAPSLLSRFAHSAGLQDMDVIRATDALVCRFIASPAGEVLAAQESDTHSPKRLVCISVALGDTATDIDAYQISRREISDGVADLQSERTDSVSFYSLPYGHAHWEAHLLEALHRHLREPLAPAQELLLKDAAAEYGESLGRAITDDTVVLWSGPFRDQMYAPLRLRVLDCLSDWPEAHGLSQELPERIREAARAAGAEDGIPDILLLGGTGARWPFAFRAAQQIGEQDASQKMLIWRSDTAEEDVARGASWWPETGAGSLPALTGDWSSSPHHKAALVPAPSVSRPKLPPAVPPQTRAAEEREASVDESAVPPSLRRLDF